MLYEWCTYFVVSFGVFGIKIKASTMFQWRKKVLQWRKCINLHSTQQWRVSPLCWANRHFVRISWRVSTRWKTDCHGVRDGLLAIMSTWWHVCKEERWHAGVTTPVPVVLIVIPCLIDFWPFGSIFQVDSIFDVYLMLFCCCLWVLISIVDKLYNLIIMMIYDKKSFELCYDVWFREEPLLCPFIGDVHTGF